MRITNKMKDKIAPEMFGLFFEDINFAADGGLYAEMIENRSFEAREAFGYPGVFYTESDFGYGWSGVAAEGEEPRLQFVEGTPLSEKNPHYLRFTAKKAMQGFKNKAYDGITLKKGMKYKVSFYARCVKFEGEGVEIRFVKDGLNYGFEKVALKKAAKYGPYCDVEPYYESGWLAADKISKSRYELDMTNYAHESDWVKYETVVEALDDIRGAEFQILLDSRGVVEFDLISMIPTDAVAGIFRADLFEALNAMHPGFIRFPGGCIVEGISLWNRYQWKNTVGELKDRTYIPNLWAFDDSRDIDELDNKRKDSHYGQSYGIGFYEYFLLCELLGAKALPVVGIAIACQFRTEEMIDIEDPRFQEYVQDAIDLIEFANGDVSTKWGALRASMGHPESFNLEMIAIGNEQWETKRTHLFERLEAFEKAIHDVYPEIKICGTAGPGIEMPMCKTAWDYYRAKYQENPNYAYAIDEHYYVSPEWLYDRIEIYDNYPREVGVFAGEYAAHPSNRNNNMEGALAEAAFLTGVEKNAGVVKLASYAPLFNRIGHSQWKPDMIWFDDKDVYLTANYYVQKLYTTNVGDYTVDMEGQEKELRADKIYVSVTKKGDKTIIKAVNCSDVDYKLPLTDENGVIKTNASIETLVSAGEEPQDMPQPSKVIKEQIEIDGKVILKAQSFNVITF